ncbi:MAG: exosortase/archaeosortase family protein [Candidatus Omnitrophota bacterium]
MKNKRAAVWGFSLSLVLLLAAYVPTIKWMIERWTAPESYYSHGFLVPLISLFIAWKKRETLKGVEIKGSAAGLMIAAVFLFINVVCAALRVYFVSGFTFVFALYGLIMYFFGKGAARRMAFPVFFLLAMVPLPLVMIGNLTVKLKLFVAQCSVWVLNHIGFPSVREGSMIRMPGSFIIVEAPCSGLRSLIALITLGVLFAFASRLSYFKKGLLLLSTVPIAMASNLVRITVLAIVNDLYGEKVAMGFFHDLSGFMVFGLAFLGLLIVNHILEGGGAK